MKELEKRRTETLIQYYGRLLWIRSEVHKCDASLFCIELEKRIDGTRAALKRHEALSISPPLKGDLVEEGGVVRPRTTAEVRVR